MEVYFLDVGQGTSQLILLGGQSAIVVDSGPATDSVVIAALHRYQVERIVRLVVTHSHRDHVASATRILNAFAGRIDEIWFLDDTELRQTRFWERLWQFVDDREIDISQLHRLECTSVPREIYRDSARQIVLWVHSPMFGQNLAAIEANDPNASSAIISCDVGNYRVAFAADSVMEQWKQIRKDFGAPLPCDVFAVPHHGGSMGDDDPRSLDWLYTDAVRAKVAVVSVATLNQHKHPNSEVISALGRNGAIVACTQITKQCCEDLESVRPGVQRPLHRVRNSVITRDVNSKGLSRRVACAGTIVVEITPSGINIPHLDRHQSGVDALARRACPMCRP
jgi:beta-lactamase superfamily II metal-dependent hydrolase